MAFDAKYARSLAALASLAVAGCGSETEPTDGSHDGASSLIRDICTAQAECEGLNDKDINACVAVTEGAEGAAASYGCSTPFDAVADCIDRTGSCESQSYLTDCGDETEALSTCEDAASGS